MQSTSAATGVLVLAVLALAVLAAPALAFSDPLAYPDAPELGGGGGRWFTGSRADGYACNACHTGGEAVDLIVAGLPVGGYAQGAAYEITVRWPVATEHMSLIAELTSAQNLAAGTIQGPDFDATDPAERCSAELDGLPASQTYDTEDGRQLLSVIDCGAAFTRFLWTAPAARDRDVWFNLGFVVADGEGDAEGDGVTLVAEPVPARGSSTATTTLIDGCSLARAGRAEGQIASPVAGLALLALGLGRLSHGPKG